MGLSGPAYFVTPATEEISQHCRTCTVLSENIDDLTR